MTGHGGLGLVQLRSSVPPFAPRHDQVADPPQDPARLPELVPVVQEKLVELSQEPFMSDPEDPEPELPEPEDPDPEDPDPDSDHKIDEFFGRDHPQLELNILQVADDPPLVPRQFQVEDDPQKPILLESLIPVVQANSVLRLQLPSTGQSGLFFLQFVASVPPAIPRQLHLDIHPHTQAS